MQYKLKRKYGHEKKMGNINVKLRTVHTFPDSLSRDPVIWVYLYEKSHL